MTVTASTAVPVTFLTLLGRDGTNASAAASASVGPTATTTGIRPLALCAEHPAVVAWRGSSAEQSVFETIGIQTDDTVIARRPRANDKVLIKRAALGSFRLSVAGLPSVKAKRLN